MKMVEEEERTRERVLEDYAKKEISHAVQQTFQIILIVAANTEKKRC